MGYASCASAFAHYSRSFPMPKRNGSAPMAVATSDFTFCDLSLKARQAPASTANDVGNVGAFLRWVLVVKLKHHRVGFPTINAGVAGKVITDPRAQFNPLAFGVLAGSRDHFFAVLLVMTASSCALLFRVAVGQDA